MFAQFYIRVGAALIAVTGLSFSAQALTMQQCSAKYKNAQEAGQIKSMKWNQFRKAECGPDADPEVLKSTEAATEEPATPTTKAPSGVTFPHAIAAKYSNESAGKGRMHTCVDAYHANKDKGTLGGLKWIEKGGGYYSLCNAKLKQ